MGVDVTMRVEVPLNTTPERVLAVSRRMVDCFGAEDFWFSDRGDKFENYVIHAKGQTMSHALELQRPYSYDSDGNYVTKGDEANYLNVHVRTLGRYYGPDYERGNFHNYMGWARFLKYHFPEGTVYYGNDSSDAEDAWTTSFENKMCKHFYEKGHAPYRGVFDNDKRDMAMGLSGANVKRPTDCPRCLVPLIRNGFGAEFGAYFCNSCDLHVETRDSGKTFINREEEKKKAADLLWKKLEDFPELQELARKAYSMW